MLRFLPVIFLVALPTVSPAQEVVFSQSASINCYDNGGGTECIGLSANLCMNDSAAGYSTVGMNACLDRELQVWDGLLNQAYSGLIDRERQIDVDEAKSSPERPSGEEALRQAQRAWIAYRDATCAYEVLQWYGGTGATGAQLSCLMRTTGEQMMYLQANLERG